ncbi:MAG TPA: N-acetylmuramoyl-L-alanine amidase [Spirochaetia bacterium]|nr:N-acetylmuramoyl-L-alanine amidase [Spirochaetia bacterium]
MKITSKRYFNTTCHIVSFTPSELRLEPHNGTPDKRENINYIWGAPNLDEVTALKATGPFFDGPNPKSEMLGAGRGDAFLNIAWDGKSLYMEPDIPSGLKEVSTSYALVRNGQECKDNEQHFSSITGSNPRMIIGQKASGEVVFIAADGRKTNEKGLTSDEQRKVCLSEGLYLAANNDGGGSVALVVEDKLLNTCYDGRGLGYIWCGYRKWKREELPVLKNGSKGMWVNLMQRYLTAWGITTEPDGSFGPATLESVKAFQEKAQITVDGSCGPQTWGKLITLTQKPTVKLPENLLAIDPGHGGSEWGGGSWFGYREKDLNLVEALRVAELLKEYKPFLVRTDDVTMSVSKHATAVKNKFKFCISIHHNATADGTTVKEFGKGNTASGCKIYISHVAGESTKKLAEYIGKAMEEVAGLKYLGAHTRVTADGKDYYAMHSGTGSTGTLIVEPLYMDNPGELQKLNVEKISQAYAQGFRKFIQEYYIKTL